MNEGQVFEQAINDLYNKEIISTDNIDFTKVQNSVIVCENKKQLNLVIQWCESQNKNVGVFMKMREKFPYCLNVSTHVVGWTDSMDRALYYVSFLDFIKKIYIENVG